MKQFYLAGFFALLLLPCAAQAQFHDNDPFGEDSDEPTAPAQPAAAKGLIEPSTAALFGTGNAGETVPGGSNLPKGSDTWGDLNTLPTDERIEDTYEMKMREENAKPMPKRDPFGNRFEDMREQMNPKKSQNRDRL